MTRTKPFVFLCIGDDPHAHVMAPTWDVAVDIALQRGWKVLGPQIRGNESPPRAPDGRLAPQCPPELRGSPHIHRVVT